MYKLVIQDDEGKTTVVPLIRDEITVGRKEGNTIRLTERNVSRRHARIMRANGSIAIEDLDSYNGVRVNGSRINGRHSLAISDRIQIGDYLIELKADDGESSQGPPEDQRTEPIEKPLEHPSASSSLNIPIAQIGPNAETTKMPSQLVPSHVRASSEPVAGGAAAAVAAAPAVAEPTPQPAVPEPHAEEARHARLTVLSSNFAGAEYELVEPTIVIGRTDDNDIIVNHRSISRNHAKITRDGSRFTITDLQSSNGVRVNNEEYDKVELRRGDIIDLGHVRLRFADPDDDYTFKPEDINDVSSGGSKAVWYALLAVLVVIVGVGVFALVRGDGGSGEDPAGTTEPRSAATSTADSGSAGKSALDTLLAEAGAAIEQRDWSLADVKAREALKLEPSNAAAQKIVEDAERENASKVRLAELRQAIEGKDYRKLEELFTGIDKSSVYYADASKARDDARDAYIGEVAAQAESLRGARKCAQLRQLQTEAAARWQEAGARVAEISSGCQQVAQSRPTRTRPPEQPRQVEEPDVDGGDDTSSGGSSGSRSPKSFDELVAEAEDAAKAGLYGKARRLCSQALELKPRAPRAVSVCAIAACNLGNERLAKRYYNMAAGQRQSQIYQICLIKGINVRE